MSTLKIKLLYPDAIAPTRAYPLDSGLDLYAHLSERVVIPPTIEFDKSVHLGGDFLDTVTFHEFATHTPTALIPTGIAIQLPEPMVFKSLDGGYETFVYEALIRPRSGLSAKHAVVCSLGTIDNPYRGELAVVLYNHSHLEIEITPGMKIAQLVVNPIIIPTVEIVSELGDSDRASNGFGSTGV